MIYDEIIKAVEEGARFTINFEKRTCRLYGKLVDLSSCNFPQMSDNEVMAEIEHLYANYKYSVPSERSESHRKYYFKALPEKSLTDKNMMYGEQREVARCKLELFILCHLLQGDLKWNSSWGSWFWQSENDKDLIILRRWIEPKQDEE